MFVCSYTPYKAVISVPSMVSGFTIEEMKKRGYFAVIGRTSNSQVALLFQQGEGDVIVLTT